MKEFFGVASLVITFVGYVPYVRDILAHRTKPHAFSWLVWAVLSAIAFAVQFTHDGGPGAWLMGLTACITFSVFLLSVRLGEKRIVPADWVSLALAGVALAVWFVTDKPLLSVVLISFIDAIGGFFPTFRKSIANPHQETASVYFIYAVSLVFSLLAFRDFSLVNTLYPISFVFINLGMAVFLVWRRSVLRTKSTERAKVVV